jgi:hypothetical protein
VTTKDPKVSNPRPLALLVPKSLLRGLAFLSWRGLHPPVETLERFLQARLPSWETLAVVLHLIPGCPRCKRITAAYWEIGTAPDDLPEEVAHRFRYEGLVDRVLSNLRHGHADLLPLTLQSPATISTNPTDSIQPNLSPRNAAASEDVISGCSVPYAATSAGEERRTAQVLRA